MNAMGFAVISALDHRAAASSSLPTGALYIFHPPYDFPPPEPPSLPPPSPPFWPPPPWAPPSPPPPSSEDAALWAGIAVAFLSFVLAVVLLVSALHIRFRGRSTRIKVSATGPPSANAWTESGWTSTRSGRRRRARQGTWAPPGAMERTRHGMLSTQPKPHKGRVATGSHCAQEGPGTPGSMSRRQAWGEAAPDGCSTSSTKNESPTMACPCTLQQSPSMLSQYSSPAYGWAAVAARHPHFAPPGTWAAVCAGAEARPAAGLDDAALRGLADSCSSRLFAPPTYPAGVSASRVPSDGNESIPRATMSSQSKGLVSSGSAAHYRSRLFMSSASLLPPAGLAASMSRCGSIRTVPPIIKKELEGASSEPEGSSSTHEEG